MMSTSLILSFTFIKRDTNYAYLVSSQLPPCHGQKCETVNLLFIYSKAFFELIIHQYGAVILL